MLATLQPLSLVALLATLVLLFGFQGDQIIDQAIAIALLAVPILIQVYNTTFPRRLIDNYRSRLTLHP